MLMLCYFLCTAPNIPSHTYRPISKVRSGSDAQFIFLADEEKNEWIYKQISDPNPDNQIVIILERLAYEIASATDIPLNATFLIAPDDRFPLRILPGYPGSLHGKVPGISAQERLPFEGFTLHQKFRSPFQIRRMGPLPEEEIGMRKSVITTMSKHPDLPKIAALDTFLGNTDRSDANIFYDQKSNRFWGIDMGNSLMGNLAEANLLQLQRIRDKESPFSVEEKEGLRSYRKTLERLIEFFPPEKIEKMLENLLEAMEFGLHRSRLRDEEAEERIEKWKKMIQSTYNSSKSLINFLLKKIEEDYVE